MSLYKQHITPKYQWGIWKVTETLAGLLALLPDHGAVYLDELSAFRSDFRKTEWLAVRVLLYTLTKEIMPIRYHSSGKPYFSANKGHLSISHTKGYVAVIISETNEVGIDIERISERIYKVAHKFVRDDENIPEDHPICKKHAFLLIWSAKEVMFKCMNAEAVDFREQMQVNLAQANGVCFRGKETRTQHESTYLINYLIDPDFVMTWTVV